MTRIAPMVAACAATITVALAGATAAFAAPVEPVRQPSLPVTIPSLPEWNESPGSWTLTSDTVVVRDDALDTGVQLLVDELTYYLRQSTPIAEASSSEAASTIRIIVDATRQEALNNEGYELSVTPTGVTITAATKQGAFWGTRTLSQMLRQQHALPAGSVVDIPQYAERGVTLCACQINHSPEWIDRFITELADLKMNYLLVELKLKSEKYPEANTFSYYTREDMKRLVTKANAYGIDVIPEINSPGHMNIWLENKPEFQLQDNAGKRHPDRLDLSNPEAVKFYMDLIDEYDGVFTSKYWHMGADEYLISSSFRNHQALTEWAQATYGPKATIADAFVAFINQVNTHVKAQGKTLRIWNDGLVPTQVVEMNQDNLIVEHWYNQGKSARTLLNEGYKVMNASVDLYYSRPGSYLNDQKLAQLYGRWHPGKFAGATVESTHPSITGAKLSIWPDDGAIQNENEVEEEVAHGMRYGAQMFWKGAVPADNPTWNSFKARIGAIGRSPQWENTKRAPLENGSYLIRPKNAEGLSMTDRAVVGESATWQLTATPDHYYQLKAVEENKCLGVYEGDRHLQTVTQVGVPVQARECADASQTYRDSRDGALRNPQKWQLIPVAGEENTFMLRNAVTLQFLTIATGTEPTHVDFLADNSRRPAAGSVVQFPVDMVQADAAKFTIVKDSRNLQLAVRDDNHPAFPAGLTLPAGITDPGITQITVTVENTGGEAITGVTVSPQRAAGWVVTPQETVVDHLKAGERKDVTFTARPTWRLGAQTVSFVASVEGMSRRASTDVVGVCGADFTPVAAKGSSEEAQGENNGINGRFIHAIDGRSDTFWHTQWSGVAPVPSFPHWIDIDLGAPVDVCGYRYLPRQGATPNGRVKDYEIYASDDEATPEKVKIAHGALPPTIERTDIALNDVTTRFLRFKGLNPQPGAGDVNVMSAAEVSVVVGKVPAQPTLVVPKRVTFNDATLTATIPTSTGVRYSIDGTAHEAGASNPYEVGRTVTVVAEPLPGYDFDNGVVTTWEHRFVKEITPEPVVFNDEAASYMVPSVDGVDYVIGSTVIAAGEHRVVPGESVVIDAALRSSEVSRFAGGAVIQWSHDFLKKDGGAGNGPGAGSSGAGAPAVKPAISMGNGTFVDTVAFTGTGFTPKGTVLVEIYSDPVVVGETTADHKGAVTFKAPMPAGIAPGSHHLVVTDQASGKTVKVVVNVEAGEAAPDAPQPSTNAPSANTPGAAQQGAGKAKAGKDGEGKGRGTNLASTGAQGSYLPAALALLTLGGVGLVLHRKRHH